MPPQEENLCVTGTLFLFGCSSLTIAGIACDAEEHLSVMELELEIEVVVEVAI